MNIPKFVLGEYGPDKSLNEAIMRSITITSIFIHKELVLDTFRYWWLTKSYVKHNTEEKIIQDIRDINMEMVRDELNSLLVGLKSTRSVFLVQNKKFDSKKWSLIVCEAGFDQNKARGLRFYSPPKGTSNWVRVVKTPHSNEEANQAVEANQTEEVEEVNQTEEVEEANPAEEVEEANPAEEANQAEKANQTEEAEEAEEAEEPNQTEEVNDQPYVFVSPEEYIRNLENHLRQRDEEIIFLKGKIEALRDLYKEKK